ncbi:PepSY domain-containing protein [Gammaproteobacteria bacterium]|nr:PepSY domain-containing protein [Gammaproteobacteria bacterium]MDB4816328.1 PepSY domain-containing protein [Gammaproteobacteria bacterium]MDC0508952.1 PepSY domain-containing protein [Gammaproteobacteria bacterium]MDC0546030.1 PepSY domain-containing protein [Gammaproteobacteria bacterium]MDC0576833.1 PepSY domain-containing protein [Gammaproteobacteria bacterium]
MIKSPRKIHKYLSLAISAQLLLWTISGIYFSFNNIEDVRGSQYLKPKEVIETAKGIKIEAQQAIDLVAEKTYLTPKSVIEITEEESGAEYRGRSLPLYKIKTISEDSKEINVYVDPFSKEIVAVRSNQWRIWDFMWGIHIMDWNERDNIGNIFLKIFSILALISSLSGIYLFFTSASRLKG